MSKTKKPTLRVVAGTEAPPAEAAAAEQEVKTVPVALRDLADAIEADKFGAIEAVTIVMLGDNMDTMCFGPETTLDRHALMLHRAFTSLSAVSLGFDEEE
jgi:hypothetical protein